MRREVCARKAACPAQPLVSPPRRLHRAVGCRRALAPDVIHRDVAEIEREAHRDAEHRDAPGRARLPDACLEDRGLAQSAGRAGDLDIFVGCCQSGEHCPYEREGLAVAQDHLVQRRRGVEHRAHRLRGAERLERQPRAVAPQALRAVRQQEQRPEQQAARALQVLVQQAPERIQRWAWVSTPEWRLAQRMPALRVEPVPRARSELERSGDRESVRAVRPPDVAAQLPVAVLQPALLRRAPQLQARLLPVSPLRVAQLLESLVEVHPPRRERPEQQAWPRAPRELPQGAARASFSAPISPLLLRLPLPPIA